MLITNRIIMKAMVLNKVSSFELNKNPLQLVELPVPQPKKGEVLIKISVCGVCHTELDEIEGRTAPAFFPVILGHQAVGKILKTGTDTNKFQIGERVGVSWIFHACGKCEFCLTGYENLCDDFIATGRDVNGGYAEYMCAPENYIYPIPEFFTDSEAAPLLCAGAIGYRSLRLAKLIDGQNLGLAGFGASAHLVLKMVKFRYPNTQVYVFARNVEERQFARELGAFWAGDHTEKITEKMNIIIDTTPAWGTVMKALENLKKGGRLVINAIRKENKDKEILKNLSYQTHLWLEKEIKSVANVTRRDVSDFFKLATEIGIKPEVQVYSLEDANTALLDLKEKNIRGAKVLTMI